NHGVLSILDSALSECPLFAWQRVEAVEYTKPGKLPEAHFQGAVLKKTNPMNILLEAEPGSDAIKQVRELGDGWVEFSVNLKGTPVEYHIFGVILLVNLEEQPVLELDDELRQLGFISFPLHGPSNWPEFNMQMVRDPHREQANPHLGGPGPPV